MNIKKVRAKNFLSFGGDWIEIDFEKFKSNIVLIKGHNLDSSEPDASNGAGKSGIISVILYGLYGKLLKNINNKAVNHIYGKKGLEIEIEVEVDGNILFIKRTRNPDTLQLKINGEDVSLGGIPATQQEIDNLFKLNFDSFVNVATFGQHSSDGFLSLTPQHKREVCENLLGLDLYSKYHEIAKKHRTFLNDSIRELGIKHEAICDNLKRSSTKLLTLKSQQDQWMKNRNAEISDLKNRLLNIKIELENLIDEGIDVEKAKIETGRIDNLIKEKEERRILITKALLDSETKSDSFRTEYESSSLNVSRLEIQINNVQQIHKKRKVEINQVEESKGKKCPRCLGTVREENIKLMTEGLKEEFISAGTQVESLQVQISQEKIKLEEISTRYNKLKTSRNKAKQEESTLLNSISSLRQERLNYNKPSVEIQQVGLQKEIDLINERLVSAIKEVEENDPFRLLILMTESEIKDSNEKIDEISAENKQKTNLQPFYEFWVRAFGDKGIRSFLLEERLPILNARINYWLNILMDNRLILSFDRDLNEEIKKFSVEGKQFVYESLSGGELKRIDLAISQAFSYLVSLASNSSPNIICLDEIGTNFDRPGIMAVYKMICNLAKDKKVFVISHDPELLELLNESATITAIMKNGVTKLDINFK